MKILQGEVRSRLRELQEKKFQVVVTSPPYWGLRSYKVSPVAWGGEYECLHTWEAGDGYNNPLCSKCGAWLGDLGLEPIPDCAGWATGHWCGVCYVCHIVEVCAEIWRVLRDDGVFWLNLGDSYAGGGCAGKNPEYHKKHKMFGQAGHDSSKFGLPQPVPPGLKQKDLVGVPWRVAFALQAWGWYLRQDVIWAKGCSGNYQGGSIMPESVLDRCTKSHEYLFMFTKSQSYYYDKDAIAEPVSESYAKDKRPHGVLRQRLCSNSKYVEEGLVKKDEEGQHYSSYRAETRNRRTVWVINSESYNEAHFAVFPPRLVEPCILAGSSHKACEICGAPWKRVLQKTGHKNQREPAHVPGNSATKTDSTGWQPTRVATDAWEPSCSCSGNNGKEVCAVLDPFMGRGTTLSVATALNREVVGIELSDYYCDLAREYLSVIQPSLLGLGM